MYELITRISDEFYMVENEFTSFIQLDEDFANNPTLNLFFHSICAYNKEDFQYMKEHMPLIKKTIGRHPMLSDSGPIPTLPPRSSSSGSVLSQISRPGLSSTQGLPILSAHQFIPIPSSGPGPSPHHFERMRAIARELGQNSNEPSSSSDVQSRPGMSSHPQNRPSMSSHSQNRSSTPSDPQSGPPLSDSEREQLWTINLLAELREAEREDVIGPLLARYAPIDTSGSSNELNRPRPSPEELNRRELSLKEFTLPKISFEGLNRPSSSSAELERPSSSSNNWSSSSSNEEGIKNENGKRKRDEDLEDKLSQKKHKGPGSPKMG